MLLAHDLAARNAAHIIGYAAMTLSFAAAASRTDKRLRQLMCCSAATWCFENLILGAQTAAVMWLVIAARTGSAAYFNERATVKVRILSFAAFYAASLLLTFMTWQGSISLTPMAASLIGCYAMFFLKGNILRFAMSLTIICQLVNAWHFAIMEYLVCGSATLAMTWIRIALNSHAIHARSKAVA